MANKRVHILERDGEFLVLPTMIEMTTADNLRIVNQTQEDLIWIVSPAATGPFGNAQVADVVKAKGGPLHIPKAASNAAALGVYEYQIIMLKSGKKAKGNSDPVIIIDT